MRALLLLLLLPAGASALLPGAQPASALALPPGAARAALLHDAPCASIFWLSCGLDGACCKGGATAAQRSAIAFNTTSCYLSFHGRPPLVGAISELPPDAYAILTAYLHHTDLLCLQWSSDAWGAHFSRQQDLESIARASSLLALQQRLAGLHASQEGFLLASAALAGDAVFLAARGARRALLRRTLAFWAAVGAALLALFALARPLRRSRGRRAGRAVLALWAAYALLEALLVARRAGGSEGDAVGFLGSWSDFVLRAVPSPLPRDFPFAWALAWASPLFFAFAPISGLLPLASLECASGAERAGGGRLPPAKRASCAPHCRPTHPAPPPRRRKD